MIHYWKPDLDFDVDHHLHALDLYLKTLSLHLHALPWHLHALFLHLSVLSHHLRHEVDKRYLHAAIEVHARDFPQI